jgi:hypothetical protein
MILQLVGYYLMVFRKRFRKSMMNLYTFTMKH